MSSSTSSSSSTYRSRPFPAFGSILSPHSATEFFTDYWETKPLHIARNNRQFYPNLGIDFTLDAFYRQLTQSNHGFRYGININICQFIDGRKVNQNPTKPENNNNTNDNTANTVDSEQRSIPVTSSYVSSHYKGGSTLQIIQPQQYIPLLRHFISRLEVEFGSLVGSNIYCTPRGSQGLAPHYDSVDVCILQLKGEKLWYLYQPIFPLPDTHSGDLDHSEIGTPSHTILLKEGDFLYLPRGTIHEAKTDPKSPESIHLTVSVYHKFHYYQLMQLAIDKAMKSVWNQELAFRRGLPLGLIDFMGFQWEQDEDNEDEEDTDKKKKNKSIVSKGARLNEITQRQGEFLHHMSELWSLLGQHMDYSGAVDELSQDFYLNRLPPWQGKVDDKDDNATTSLPILTPMEENNMNPGLRVVGEPPNSIHSCIRFRYPNYIRITIGSKEKDKENGDRDDEDEEDEDEDDDNDEDSDSYCLLTHSVSNDIQSHLTAPTASNDTSRIELPLLAAPFLIQLVRNQSQFMSLYQLSQRLIDLDDEEMKYQAAMEMALTLWGVGLIDVKNENEQVDGKQSGKGKGKKNNVSIAAAGKRDRHDEDEDHSTSSQKGQNQKKKSKHGNK